MVQYLAATLALAAAVGFAAAAVWPRSRWGAPVIKMSSIQDRKSPIAVALLFAAIAAVGFFAR
jgi:hypothetical protein